MGGTKEEYYKNLQFQKASKDLLEVTFFVYFTPEGNFSIFDQNKVYSDLCKLVSKTLASYGIKHKDLGPVGGLGGGAETFIDIIRMLWDFKALIPALIALYRYSKRLLQKYFNARTDTQWPHILVNFSIGTDAQVNRLSSSDLQYILSPKLSNLLQVSESVAKEIREKYKYMQVDYSANANINSKKYTISFQILDKLKDKNISRMLNIISNFKIKNNLYSTYTWGKWLTIRRSDVKTIIKNGEEERIFLRPYYLFLSTKVLWDYANK